MYQTKHRLQDQIIGPTRLVDIDAILHTEPDGSASEIYSYGILPMDLYSIFLDTWQHKYMFQVVIKARNQNDAMDKFRFLHEKGRYKIALDPAVNATPQRRSGVFV